MALTRRIIVVEAPLGRLFARRHLVRLDTVDETDEVHALDGSVGILTPQPVLRVICLGSASVPGSLHKRADQPQRSPTMPSFFAFTVRTSVHAQSAVPVLVEIVLPTHVLGPPQREAVEAVGETLAVARLDKPLCVRPVVTLDVGESSKLKGEVPVVGHGVRDGEGEQADQ